MSRTRKAVLQLHPGEVRPLHNDELRPGRSARAGRVHATHQDLLRHLEEEVGS